MLEYFIVSLALLWSAHATPTGNHTCTGVVKHEVTVRVNVTEPVTFRAYEWCLRVPPRCSTYTIQLKDRVKIHKEMHNRTITVCCKGYVEIDYKCVPACPPENECPNMHCNRTNHCYCTPGYTGLYCNSPCPKGFWGAGCIKQCDCPAGYTCHHLTGDCMEDDIPATKSRRTTSSEFLTEVPTTIQTTLTTTRVPTTIPTTPTTTQQPTTIPTTAQTTTIPTTTPTTTTTTTTPSPTTTLPTTTPTTTTTSTTTTTTPSPTTTLPTTTTTSTTTTTTPSPTTTLPTTTPTTTTTTTPRPTTTIPTTTTTIPTTVQTVMKPVTTEKPITYESTILEKTETKLSTYKQQMAEVSTMPTPVTKSKWNWVFEIATASPTLQIQIKQESKSSGELVTHSTTNQTPSTKTVSAQVTTEASTSQRPQEPANIILPTAIIHYEEGAKEIAETGLVAETEASIRTKIEPPTTTNTPIFEAQNTTSKPPSLINFNPDLRLPTFNIGANTVQTTNTVISSQQPTTIVESKPITVATTLVTSSTTTIDTPPVTITTVPKPSETTTTVATSPVTTTTVAQELLVTTVPPPSMTFTTAAVATSPVTPAAPTTTTERVTTLTQPQTTTSTLSQGTHSPHHTEMATEVTAVKTTTFVDTRNYDEVPKSTGITSQKNSIPNEKQASGSPNIEHPAIIGKLFNVGSGEVDQTFINWSENSEGGVNIKEEVKGLPVDQTSVTDSLDRLIVEDVPKPPVHLKPTTDESPIKLVEEVISKYFPDTLFNPLPGLSTPKEPILLENFRLGSVESKKSSKDAVTIAKLPSTVEVTTLSATEATTLPVTTTTVAPSSAPTTPDISTIPIITPKVIVSAKNPDEIDLGGVIYRKMKFFPQAKSVEDTTAAPMTTATPTRKQEQPTTPEEDRFKIYLPEYERESDKEMATTPPVKTFMPKFNYDKEEYDYGKLSQPKKSKQKEKDTKKYKVKPQEVTAPPSEDVSNERVTNNVFLETKEFKVHLASTKAQKYGEGYYTKSAMDHDSSVHDWSKYNKKKGKYGTVEAESTKQVKFTLSPSGYGLEDGATTRGLTEALFPTTNAKPPHTWYSHAREKAKIKNALKALKSTTTYDNVKPTEDSMVEESNDIHSLATQYTEREPRAAVAAAVTYQEDPNNPQMFGQIKFNAPESFSSSRSEVRGSSAWVVSLAVGGACFLAMATIVALLWLRLKRRRTEESAHGEEYDERQFTVKDTSSSELNTYETVYPVTNESDRLEVETFFCPTFTNNYAERINRELNELSYDHPRSSIVEPLYAEILHPKIKEVE